MKKDDIYNMYNELDDMISSIDIKKEDIVEEEPVIVIEDEEKINNVNLDEENPEIVNIDINDDDLEETMVFKPIKEETIEYVSEKTEEHSNLNEEVLLEQTEELPENSKEKNKKKKSNKKWVITFGILDIIALVCLFLMYGPISYFRNLWVTSAMTTATHQYLAYIFFNEDSVQKILDNNTVIESGESTNENEINFEVKEPVVYESIYEEQVLKKDEENDLYKVIDIEGDGYKGHMVVVYDASRVTLFEAPNINFGGKQMDTMIKLADAYVGMNASGFSRRSDGGLNPAGSVIMNGKVVHNNGSTGWGGGIIGFTNDNVLVLTKSSPQEAIKMGVRDAVSFGPFLIVNGQPSEFKGNGGYGIAPRTAIGQRKDGIVLMLVIDGRRPGHSLGVDMLELTNIMLKYGAYNASNLDGGGSSSLAVEGEIINVAGGSGYSGNRYLPNAWIVK